MLMPSVDVYLLFADEVPEAQRSEFLTRLEGHLPPSMELMDRDRRALVRASDADVYAALVAVQTRAVPIRDALGLGDQVTWSLEPW